MRINVGIVVGYVRWEDKRGRVICESHSLIVRGKGKKGEGNKGGKSERKERRTR